MSKVIKFPRRVLSRTEYTFDVRFNGECWVATSPQAPDMRGDGPTPMDAILLIAKALKKAGRFES